MAIQHAADGPSLIDVLDRVLDKGIIVDAWMRVSLVGIDMITIESHVIVASFDTYLSYSEPLRRMPAVAGPRGIVTDAESFASPAPDPEKEKPPPHRRPAPSSRTRKKRRPVYRGVPGGG
jgi:gas vesicle structural protein